MARTDRQLAGDAAEELVAERLAERGWRILARNLRFGRCELDIVAVDPGPPARLVVVEVRWRSSRAFGGAEESFNYRKRGQLRLGLGRLLESGRLPDGSSLPHLPVAVDLAVVEPGSGGAGSGGGGGGSGAAGPGSGCAAPLGARATIKLYRNAVGE